MRKASGIVLVVLWFFASGLSHAEDVWLLSTGQGAAQRLADRVRAALPAGWTMTELRLGERPLEHCPGTRLILAEGEESARAALQGCPSARVWAFALPALSLSGLQREAPGRVSGIGADVPFAHQAEVLARLRPRPESVAVPFSPEAAGLAREAERALHAAGFRVILLSSEPLNQPLRPLREVLGEVHAVLALPDSTLYHEGLLKHWLLMTAREGVPMIGGLGRRSVQRGMVAAAVQQDEAVATLTLRLLPQLLGSGPMPAPQRVEASMVVENAFMLDRLGLRLAEGQ
ncbi:MAG: hypothetical protein AB1344_04335 [Pseudomonadota bacterium]